MIRRFSRSHCEALSRSSPDPRITVMYFKFAARTQRQTSAIFSAMPRILHVIFLALALVLPAFAKDKHQRPAPVNSTRGDKWAEKTLRKLSVEEKIGQVF